MKVFQAQGDFKNCLFIFLIMLLTSCASYNPGKKALLLAKENEKKNNLSANVYGELISTYSTHHFALIDFSFENTSEDWIRIKEMTLDLGAEEFDKKANIIAGNDLLTWGKAISRKVKVDDFNRSILLSALSIGGLVTAGVSKSDTLAAAGTITAFTSYTIFAVNSLYREITELEMSQLFPDDHLYRNFSIPPGLSTKKWIVLKIKRKDIPRYIYLNMTTIDGQKRRFKLEI